MARGSIRPGARIDLHGGRIDRIVVEIDRRAGEIDLRGVRIDLQAARGAGEPRLEAGNAVAGEIADFCAAMIE